MARSKIIFLTPAVGKIITVPTQVGVQAAYARLQRIFSDEQSFDPSHRNKSCQLQSDFWAQGWSEEYLLVYDQW